MLQKVNRHLFAEAGKTIQTITLMLWRADKGLRLWLRLHRTKRDLADSILEGTSTSHAISLEELRELVSEE